MLLSDGRELRFRLRVRAGIRGLRLAVSHHTGMVVTIPRGLDRSRIPAILEEKRAWIEDALRRYPMLPAPYQPPERIALRAVGEEWTIHYADSDPNPASGTRLRVTLTRQGDKLLHVTGAVHRSDLVRRVLEKWLVIQARRHLPPWLQRVAGELGLAPTRISVRFQHTLWGSCSARNTISLNARLLLIPPDLVRYVFVHELMHMRNRNHSRAFWQDVAVHIPDYREKRAQLRRLWHALEI